MLPLLVQTGYLTIQDYDKTTRLFTLTYPNYEVENSFLSWLLDAFSQTDQGFSEGYLTRLVSALKAHDLDAFFETLKVTYAKFDYDLQIANEKYYQTIFYLVFKLIGLQIAAEVKTNRGRIDAVVELEDHIYLFEFKINQDAQVALDQIEEKAYAEKYQLDQKQIVQVGANFDMTTRTISDWESVNSH